MLMAPEFWVAVAFIIFMVLVWKKASAAIGSMLDARAEKIRAELDEAYEEWKNSATAAFVTTAAEVQTGLKAGVRKVTRRAQ